MNNKLDQGDIVHKEKFNLKGNVKEIYTFIYEII